MDRDLVRLLLNDSEGHAFTDYLIDKLIEIFTPAEILLACMILTDMTIKYDKMEKFIKAVNETQKEQGA